MRITTLLSLLLFCLFYQSQAQNVGIGTSAPHSSAKLEIQDTERGILIPQISIPDLNAAAPVATPAVSLLVYNTNATSGTGYYYWEGTRWVQLLDEQDNDWNINANGTGLEMGTGNGNSATGDFSIAAGNLDTASGYVSTVSGGELNKALADYSTVSGGYDNTTSNFSTTIGGGAYNRASENSATVAGGFRNNAAGAGSAIAGGRNNNTRGLLSTIGGGDLNSTDNDASTVGGGFRNLASGEFSTIAGGSRDTATGRHSFIGGGRQNSALDTFTTIVGGASNRVSNEYATILGGSNNDVAGRYGTILGGSNNNAVGNYSLLFGNNNQANSYGETVLGVYATNYTANSTTAFNANDRLFNIGNGTSNAARADAFTILKNGNTGIGTNIPSSKLTVLDNSTNSSKVSVLTNNASTISSINLTSTVDGGGISMGIAHALNTYGDNAETYIYSSANMRGLNIMNNNSGGFGHIAFFTSGSHANGASTLFLSDNDRVGIGTETPAEKLHVQSSRILLTNGSDAVYTSENTASGYRFELIGSYPGWDSRAIYLGGYNVNNVGSPNYSNANKVYCGGTAGSIPIHATAFNTASSATFKQNISTLTYGLKEVLQIRPVTYQYNFDKTGLYKVGFIAEEVSQIIPEIVAHHDEEDNIVSREEGKAVAMDYSQMTAVLVNAIKEQQAQIEELKEKIKKLEADKK